MENLTLLWEYQKADIELQENEAQLKNTPTRKQLVKLQRFLKNAQEKLAEMENASKVKKNKISEMTVQYTTLLADMEDLNKDLSYFSECDDEELDSAEIKGISLNCEKVYDGIVAVKKMLAQLKQEIEVDAKTIRETLQKMKAAKAEYDVLKEQYAQEIKGMDQEIAAYEEKRNAFEAKIDPVFLKEYKRIKGIRQQPVAVLRDSHCSGCNMQLPSSSAGLILDGKKPFLCENCGRILIVLE